MHHYCFNEATHAPFSYTFYMRSRKRVRNSKKCRKMKALTSLFIAHYWFFFLFIFVREILIFLAELFWKEVELYKVPTGRKYKLLKPTLLTTNQYLLLSNHPPKKKKLLLSYHFITSITNVSATSKWTNKKVKP